MRIHEEIELHQHHLFVTLHIGMILLVLTQAARLFAAVGVLEPRAFPVFANVLVCLLLWVGGLYLYKRVWA